MKKLLLTAATTCLSLAAQAQTVNVICFLRVHL